MEISWNKAQELTEAIGEGAELRVQDSGNAVIYLNRLAPEREADFDLPMANLTIYNKKVVSFEEAEKLFVERRPFQVYGGKLTAEWVEDDLVYAVTSYGKVIYQFLKDSGWELLIIEDEFRALKPTVTMYRHYNWVHAQLFATHNNGAAMPEDMYLKGKGAKPKPDNDFDL